MKVINVIIMIILVPIMLVLYVPFALLRVFTSKCLIDEYFDIWSWFLDILMYPIAKYEERKEHYEELKSKIKGYREKCEQLDKKLWKKEEVIEEYVRIVPIKRTKQGKAISAALSSYNAVTDYWKILKELGLKEGSGNRITLPQLLHSKTGHFFIRLGDNIRADKENPDLVEITMSEYERLIGG